MGSYFVTQAVTTPKNCLAPCVDRRQLQEGDDFWKRALRDSRLLTNAVVFLNAIHLLDNNEDVMHYILRLLIEENVAERIATAFSMVLDSWYSTYDVATNTWHLRPLNSNRDQAYGFGKMLFSNRGRRYKVSYVFWFDDIYHNIICPCSLRRGTKYNYL